MQNKMPCLEFCYFMHVSILSRILLFKIDMQMHKFTSPVYNAYKAIIQYISFHYDL